MLQVARRLRPRPLNWLRRDTPEVDPRDPGSKLRSRAKLRMHVSNLFPRHTTVLGTQIFEENIACAASQPRGT